MVFLELLTGKVPYSGYNKGDIRKMIDANIREKIPDDCQMRYPNFSNLVMNCLQ